MTKTRAPQAALALTLSSLVILAGCSGASPSKDAASVTSSPAATAQPPVINLTEAKTIAADYTKNNNIAIKKAGTGDYDAKAWESVDTGPVLRGDLAATRWHQLMKHDKAETWTLEADSVFTPKPTAYPNSFVIVSNGKEWTSLSHFIQEAPNGPYLMSQSATVLPKDVPKAETPGEGSLSEQEKGRVKDALSKVSQVINGTTPSGLKSQFPPDLLLPPLPVKEDQAKPRVSLKTGPFNAADPKECIAVKTKDGVLVIASTVVTFTQKSTSGTMTLPMKEYRTFYGVPKATKSFQGKVNFTVTVKVPDKGQPTFVSYDLRRLLS